ncbi:MAG: HNH endonuclease signature motif containing protein [Actinomycetota bacterium]|nr:HNH endonuclease signature motif containing protein [Actinomycetota bacterium]
MGISDKTRKVLWGRSGNRCAICKHELVLAASSSDEESVVGEECHIISGKVGGPRYDSGFPLEQIDAYENLILLCRVHHKAVDDQSETYTADILRQMKMNHEKWVSEKLKDTEELKPVRLRRTKNGTPEFLTRLTSGKEVLNVVENANGFSFDHDELLNEEEVDLVGGFLQIAQDWGDLSPMESYDRVRIAFDLTETLKELEDAGFLVFGGREIRVIEGGTEVPSAWPIAVIRILRKTNKEIIKVTYDGGND